MNRFFIPFVAILLSSRSFLAMAVEPTFDKPNVLFIAVDDLNHWVGFMGRNAQTKTPNLDRLAARGVAFTQAHCAVPACNPSRAALMSGLRPWNTACYTNGDNWKKHIPEGISLSAQFLKAGYHVAGAGKIYHSDTYYEPEWTEYMCKEGISAHGKGVGKDEGFHEPLAHDLKDEDLGDYSISDLFVGIIPEKNAMEKQRQGIQSSGDVVLLRFYSQCD